MSIAGGLTNLGVIAIVVHQIPFFTSSVGLSEGLAAATVTAMTLLSLLGRLGFGYLADTMDKRYVTAACYGDHRVRLFSCTRLSTKGGRCSTSCLCSRSASAEAFPCGRPSRRRYFGLKAFGAIQGLAFTIATLGGLLGPVFAGWMYDVTESYRLAFVALSAGSFLAVPLVLSVSRPYPSGEGAAVPRRTRLSGEFVWQFPSAVPPNVTLVT